MWRSYIGDIGHLFVIVAFVSAIVTAVSYFINNKSQVAQPAWLLYARTTLIIHCISIVGVLVIILMMLYHHFFEYYYVWSHSSLQLSTQFLVSCLWEGQEGSFLIWIFWQAIIALFLIKRLKQYEAPFMVVFCLVQAVLCSMLLGIVIFDVKIGSSPFLLVSDVIDAPIFKSNPEYIPEDGTGLNPLLQNYWMVIHPPTLFLGFALTLVPFSLCIAGLWKKKYTEWIGLMLPWLQLAAIILGIGIVMGAYWAYETLNFGGYWNWDPVENAVYVPWLILIAAIHAIILFKNKRKAYRLSVILIIAAFLLILYSTFLTRSGILGDSSVHSFTDLGLSGQLLLFLLLFVGLSALLLIKRWKEMPSNTKEDAIYSSSFWMFVGCIMLCLMSFQVLIPTSIPVFNSVKELFGGVANIAPPADAVSFYSNFQLWFCLGISILTGTIQLIWWNKFTLRNFREVYVTPLLFSLLIATIGISILKVYDFKYILLFFFSIYGIVANALILIKLAKQKFVLTAGALAHIGIGFMFIGILFSAGYSKVISLNKTGLIISKEADVEFNNENTILWIGESRKVAQMDVTYQGRRKKIKGTNHYVPLSLLVSTEDPHLMILKDSLYNDYKLNLKRGDTIEVSKEDIYYEVYFDAPDINSFSLYPRAQINPTMGLLASPAIKKYWNKDLYTHVSSVPDPDAEPEWSDTQKMTISLGDTFQLNDYIAHFRGVQRIFEYEDIELNEKDYVIQLDIELNTGIKIINYRPVYLIKENMVARPAEVDEEMGIQLWVEAIHPEQASFELGVKTTGKDYVILKVVEKPYINLLWAGFILVIFGFFVAIYRRMKELS